MTKNPTDYKTAYYDLMLTEKVHLRERIAIEVQQSAYGWDSKRADSIFEWIRSDSSHSAWDKKTAGTPPWEEAAVAMAGNFPGFIKPKTKKKAAKTGKKKRAYVKKSTFWKKKRK